MNTLRESDLHIRSIGTLAMEALSIHQRAIILGTTSRGIFLQAAEDRIVFLSFEGYRGPLTANLAGDMKHLWNLSPGGSVVVSQEQIGFVDSGISISTSGADIWRPSEPVGLTLNSVDRTDLIRNLASDVYQQRGAEGLGEMLPVLAGFSPRSMIRDNHVQGAHARVHEIGVQIARGDLLPIFQTVQGFLGLGSGLTPSGDDFIIGLLLSMNRWKSILRAGDLSILSQKVVEAAYASTTTLSANLIECAALGLADERLIKAVDFLATARHRQSAVVHGLLNWGNSSGVDALVGMITAFSPV